MIVSDLHACRRHGLTANYLGILLICLALPGCTYLQAQSRVDPRTIAIYGRGKTVDLKVKTPEDSGCPRKLHGDNHSGAVNLDCFYFPEDIPGEGQDAKPNRKTAYAEAVSSPSSTARNRFAAILMKHSDDICTIEMGRLVADEAITNTALATLTSGFSAAASVVSGETAKSILSGIATTTSATRAHINSEVYRNALSTAITRAIAIERKNTKEAIQAKFIQPPGTYTVDHMILDVNEYHQSCSFFHGIALINEAVDKGSPDSPDKQRLIEIAVKGMDDRVLDLERQLAAADTSEENQREIKAQIAALRQKQTQLMVPTPPAISPAPNN